MSTDKSFYCIILIALLLVYQVNATDWYVDNAATGANSGTSWVDAWQNFADIGWESIEPGDRIYISGGETEKTYSENLRIGASGSFGNNITISVGQDTGHNGNVIITNDGPDGGFVIRGEDYITVSGNVNGERKLTIRNCNVTGVYVTGSNHIKLLYLNVFHNGDEAGEHGISFSTSSETYEGEPIIEIAHCHIHNNWHNAILGLGTGLVATDFEYVKIHHNLITDTNVDAFECSASGVDFYNNHINGKANNGAFGHSDGVVINVGYYYRFYNNIFHGYKRGTAYIYIGPFATATHFVSRYIYIYNNLIYEENVVPIGGIYREELIEHLGLDPSNDSHVHQVNDLFENLMENGYVSKEGVIEQAFYELNDYSEMILDPVYDAQKSLIFDFFQDNTNTASALRAITYVPKIENTTIEHILIANNTIINMPNTGLSARFNDLDSGNVNDVTIVNNVVHNCYTNGGGTASWIAEVLDDNMIGSSGSGAEIIYDYNIFSSGEDGSGLISYGDVWGLTQQELAASPYYLNIHGSDASPSLSADFKPNDGSDPIVDSGLDLSEYFTTDIDGISRPQGFAWDIGAYEYITETNITDQLTKENQLLRIYPNPFKSSTIIEYTLPEALKIDIVLYDVTGKKIKDIYSGHEEAGVYTLNVTLNNTATGIYFCKLKAGNYSSIKKCIAVH